MLDGLYGFSPRIPPSETALPVTPLAVFALSTSSFDRKWTIAPAEGEHG